MSAAPEDAARSIDPAAEAAMEKGHRFLWRHAIRSVPEAGLSFRAVPVFDCDLGAPLSAG